MYDLLHDPRVLQAALIGLAQKKAALDRDIIKVRGLLTPTAPTAAYSWAGVIRFKRPYHLSKAGLESIRSAAARRRKEL